MQITNKSVQMACVAACLSVAVGCSKTVEVVAPSEIDEPVAESEAGQADQLYYAGFQIDMTPADDQEFEWQGRTYTHGFVRDAVRSLMQDSPYEGPLTRDLSRTPFGSGSGTGLRLIAEYLANAHAEDGG